MDSLGTHILLKPFVKMCTPLLREKFGVCINSLKICKSVIILLFYHKEISYNIKNHTLLQNLQLSVNKSKMPVVVLSIAFVTVVRWPRITSHPVVGRAMTIQEILSTVLAWINLANFF